MRVLDLQGGRSQTHPPGGRVWAHGQDGVPGDSEVGAGVIGHSGRIASLDGQSHVDETHCTKIQKKST